MHQVASRHVFLVLLIGSSVHSGDRALQGVEHCLGSVFSAGNLARLTNASQV
jgi:hypothetical protein